MKDLAVAYAVKRRNSGNLPQASEEVETLVPAQEIEDIDFLVDEIRKKHRIEPEVDSFEDLFSTEQEPEAELPIEPGDDDKSILSNILAEIRANR